MIISLHAYQFLRPLKNKESRLFRDTYCKRHRNSSLPGLYLINENVIPHPLNLNPEAFNLTIFAICKAQTGPMAYHFAGTYVLYHQRIGFLPLLHQTTTVRKT